MDSHQRLTKLSRITVVTYLGIIGVWVIAWMTKTSLLSNIPWFETPVGDFLYWTTAKVLIWILPAFWLLRVSKRTVRELYALKSIKKSLIWGGGIGIVIVIFDLISKYLAHQPIISTSGFALVNVLVVAPIFEEFLMRGVILGNLQKQFSLWTSNLVTAVMFVGLHLPGWYFMGKIELGMVVTIFLIGIVLGFVAQKGNSVIASTLCHFLNNLGNI